MERTHSLPAPPDERALRLSRLVLSDLFGPPAKRTFAVRFWDGSRDAPARELTDFDLVLRHPGALRNAFLPPTEASLGGAYVAGDLDIEGDVEAAARLAEPLRRRMRSPGVLARLVTRAARLPRGPGSRPGRTGPVRGSGAKHSRRRDAVSVRSHYDVGNEFFQTFLDRRLVYSCAYFVDDAEDLGRAQEAKLEHICRKLRLHPGEHLLDVGCGWGALVQYAVERHGVQALGITLSEPQAEFARDRVRASNLSDRCRIEVLDYRELPPHARFDKVVSVGMVEHVGRAMLATYFREIAKVMTPGGLFLNHGIVSLGKPDGTLAAVGKRLFGARISFMQRFVFPDSELVGPADMIARGEEAGLELRDLESLREHYTRTLRCWVRRLEARRGEAVALAGEETYRVWRLYMAASAAFFASGRTGVIQSLWGRPRADGTLDLPKTRADLYRPFSPITETF